MRFFIRIIFSIEGMAGEETAPTSETARSIAALLPIETVLPDSQFGNKLPKSIYILVIKYQICLIRIL